MKRALAASKPEGNRAGGQGSLIARARDYGHLPRASVKYWDTSRKGVCEVLEQSGVAPTVAN